MLHIVTYHDGRNTQKEIDMYTDKELLDEMIQRLQNEMENLEEYGDEVHIREYDMRAVTLAILLDAYAKMNGN